MPARVNFDTDNTTVKDLIKMVDDFASTDAKDLTGDQVALLNLKKIIDGKSVMGGGAAECFICGTGA